MRFPTPPRQSYPSDLTNDQWSFLERLLPPERADGLGRPREVDLREVINGILYLLRSGCQWDMLPHDLPPKSTTYEYFARWRDDGTWQRIMDALREQARTAAARQATPSAASVDSQSVKTTNVGGERGYDGAKKVTGRKRHIFVDTLGFLLAVAVTSAALDDAAAAPQLLAQVTPDAAPTDQDLGRLEISQSWFECLAKAGTTAMEFGDRFSPCRRERFRAAAQTLGGRADLQLDWTQPTTQQGLRTTNRFQ